MPTHRVTKSHDAAMADESAGDSVDGESKSSSSCITGMSGMEKKKRRGVIEKRRRDRINCSLYDLKRLVPEITYKTGSSKLEKAEILQATVDFLQRLYKDGHVLSSEARAIELRRLGFRECLLEVNRILASYQQQQQQNQEQVPMVQFHELRRGLLASLQHYDQQQEAQSKAYLASVAAMTSAMATEQPPQPQPQAIPQTSGHRHRLPGDSGVGQAMGKSPVGPCASHNYRYAWTQQALGEGNMVPHAVHLTQSLIQQQSHGEHVYVPNDISYIPNNPMSTTSSTTTTPVAITGILCDGGLAAVNSKILALKGELENETGNSSLGMGNSLAVYRPNESQSTSSPPLRLTPEDPDSVSSPQLPGGFPQHLASSTNKCLDYITKRSPPGEQICDLFLSSGNSSTTLSGRDERAPLTYSTTTHHGVPLAGPASGIRRPAFPTAGHEVKQGNFPMSYSAQAYQPLHGQQAPTQACLDQYAQDAGRLAFIRQTNGAWDYGPAGVRCEASSPLQPPSTDSYLTGHSYWQY